MNFTVREASIQFDTKRTALTKSIPFKGDIVRDLVNSSPLAPTSFEMIEMIDQGLPFQEFEDLQACLDLPKVQLAELVGISKATLHRREASLYLHPAESDRVIRYARLLGRAIDVFESLDAARRWMKAPQFALGHAVPLQFASTETGAREVEDLLGRIEYGVYS